MDYVQSLFERTRFKMLKMTKIEPETFPDPDMHIFSE